MVERVPAQALYSLIKAPRNAVRGISSATSNDAIPTILSGFRQLWLQDASEVCMQLIETRQIGMGTHFRGSKLPPR